MIAVIDYGMGNLRSVSKALEKTGAAIVVTAEADKIRESEALVLPGVGAFGQAMEELRRRGIVQPIVRCIEEGKPFLGICLGLQLLFSESEEGGGHKGLGVFAGRVRRFPNGVKVPHIGWNSITKCTPAGQSSAIFTEVPDRSYFYFVHSYYVEPEDGSIVATATEYGGRFASSVVQGNVFACQFHPEKSQKLGLQLLKNFAQSFNQIEEFNVV